MVFSLYRRQCWQVYYRTYFVQQRLGPVGSLDEVQGTVVLVSAGAVDGEVGVGEAEGAGAAADSNFGCLLWIDIAHRIDRVEWGLPCKDSLQIEIAGLRLVEEERSATVWACSGYIVMRYWCLRPLTMVGHIDYHLRHRR